MSELEKLPDRVSAVASQSAQFGEDLRRQFADFRREMCEQFDELNRELRVMHEEIVSRIELILEGQRARRSRRTGERVNRRTDKRTNC